MSRTLRNRPHWAESRAEHGKGPGLNFRGRSLVRDPYYNGRDGRRGGGVCDAHGPKPRNGWAEIEKNTAFYKRKASKKVRVMTAREINEIVADLLEDKLALEAQLAMDEAILEDAFAMDDMMGGWDDDPWSENDWERALGGTGNDDDDIYDRMMHDPFYYEADYY